MEDNIKMDLRGAISKISNLYNFSPRLLLFGTHIQTIITITQSFVDVSLIFLS